jgi:hypothetical protein
VRLKELAEDWKAKQSQLHLQEPTKAQPVKID